MPSRFLDLDSDYTSSFLSNKKESKPRTGLRQPRDLNTARRISTSTPASATTTASSTTSSPGSASTPHGPNKSSQSVWNTVQSPRQSLDYLADGVNFQGKVYNREHCVEPTAQVQEWAHQMHIRQRREYWWCSSCHPKTPTLQIPNQKALKRVRIVEPTHAYE